jgi:membrane protease YdiL (CAAX protease family)
MDKVKLGFALFLLGTIGVLSMLTVNIPLDSLPKLVTEQYSPDQIKWLILINPSFLMLIGVILGTALHDKTGLNVPSIKALLKIEVPPISFWEQIKSGVVFGIVSGIIITIIGAIFQGFLPPEFIALSGKMDITPVARLLYGGITEELLMRFGFMTLVVWTVFKIRKSLSNATYYIGILLSSLLFALGHLPVVYTLAHPSIMLVLYIIIGNASAGILFGYQYWKKGLEAAMIAHMFAHLTMMLGENILHLK